MTLTAGLVNFQARCKFRHQQSVIHTLVDRALQLLLDRAEIQHHRLRIERAGQFDIDDPAFAHQPALRVQVGAVDHGQLFDEQTGHGVGMRSGRIA